MSEETQDLLTVEPPSDSTALMEAQKWQAFRLATRGFRNEQAIAKELNTTSSAVSTYLKEAIAEIRDRAADQDATAFITALTRMEGVGAKLWDRIEESLCPDLDVGKLRDDLIRGRTTAETVDRYYRYGLVQRRQLAADVETGDPELAAVGLYIIPGQLDLQTCAQYVKVVESTRKLQGVDRDRTRVELTGKETAVAAVNDIQAEIIAMAHARKAKQAKVIEVAAKGAKRSS